MGERVESPQKYRASTWNLKNKYRTRINGQKKIDFSIYIFLHSLRAQPFFTILKKLSGSMKNQPNGKP
jgi:hypothetical protein